MDVIKIGEYIVIQKQNYKKLHKFNKVDSCICLGKDNINLTGIDGCRYNSIFRLMPTANKRNRQYRLELAQEAIELKNEIDVKISGSDNRNIQDDGNSQKLTAAEIEELKCEENKASDIVEKLITNSNTFHNKTGFSQEKYLKKKEKKYFEYIQIVRPNIRIIAEIMFKLDPTKIQGMRIDTLSQLITACNIHSEGNYLLYDSGSNGLIAASLLSAIGNNTNGKLVHMHPGNMSQKQALLAMNFSEEQFNRCISVNIYSALRQYYQGCDKNSIESPKEKNIQSYSLKRKCTDNAELKVKIPKLTDTEEKEIDEDFVDLNISIDKQSEPKKPKWHYDNIAATEILSQKMDSLIIVCKEDPLNLFNELLVFIKPGRPFVVYYSVVEPLQHMYLALKQQSNIAALRITNNWMRNYQVLPDRTHPEVTMNTSSGFLLTGYILK